MDLNQRKSYLILLTFHQTDARLQNIDEAHESMCLWLLKQPEYQKWLSPEQLNFHGGFFWIKGKTGVGKSTMMKYIFIHTKEKMKDTIVLSFFFQCSGRLLRENQLLECIDHYCSRFLQPFQLSCKNHILTQYLAAAERNFLLEFWGVEND